MDARGVVKKLVGCRSRKLKQTTGLTGMTVQQTILKNMHCEGL